MNAPVWYMHSVIHFQHLAIVNLATNPQTWCLVWGIAALRLILLIFHSPAVLFSFPSTCYFSPFYFALIHGWLMLETISAWLDFLHIVRSTCYSYMVRQLQKSTLVRLPHFNSYTSWYFTRFLTCHMSIARQKTTTQGNVPVLPGIVTPCTLDMLKNASIIHYFWEWARRSSEDLWPLIPELHCVTIDFCQKHNAI